MPFSAGSIIAAFRRSSSLRTKHLEALRPWLWSSLHESHHSSRLPAATLQQNLHPRTPAFVTSLGHLMGYDAGYYGYAWADAIAADMETVFKEAPNGFYNQAVGRRLRDEIYAPGGSRDVEESIRIFLGRERSIKPFLKKIGIKEN